MSTDPSRGRRSLTELARAGFVELDAAADALDALEGFGVETTQLVPLLSECADPDQAAAALLTLLRRHPVPVAGALVDPAAARALVLLVGASTGFIEFFGRAPEALDGLVVPSALPRPDDLVARMLASVAADGDGFAGVAGDAGRVALRKAYRGELARIAAYDLGHPDPGEALPAVADALSDLAAATLEAALALGRTRLVDEAPVQATRVEVAGTVLTIVAMGKTGARELNYVSDVDVIFAADTVDGALGKDGEPLADARMLDVATKLARAAMRAIDEMGVEPPLWQVDANLRPEGKDGALVRTVASHRGYYDRWASDWEFQALLKARPVAGDRGEGERYLESIRPLVWQSAARDGFVAQVQRMRGRVTDNIPPDEVDVQLKLGPGGLRDVEFTVQLLQLVHGRTDETVRQRGTLPALASLAAAGYIGRLEAAEFAADYRFLRLLEHRLQLTHLSRTHLMPRDEAALRVLARAARVDGGATGLVERWHAVQQRVRGLHERLFYRPLLAAVARLPEEELALTSAQAEDRLAGIGFQRPREALAHIGALTGGVSRRASIQRHLLPVILEWLARGADPDGGLLAFRRLSEKLGDTAWYLRMLRDSSFAAQRLADVLSHARLAADLLERFPEAAAWLESDADLMPRAWSSLDEETMATVARHADPATASAALRTARRREVLRVALAGVLGLISIDEIGTALSDVTTALLRGTLRIIRRDWQQWPEFGVVAMGRYGGRELGYGSDADLMYVYRPLPGQAPEVAQQRAERIAALIKEYTTDPLLPFDIDLDLRPEGKNGAVVRTLASYRAYYERWSLTWEAQALLRARGVVGDASLIADFMTIADEVRYPAAIGEAELREVRRIKARVENERMPRGVDPKRHLKLGRGSLSDVEWIVQYWQLQHAAAEPTLRTPSTLDALTAAQGIGLVDARDADALRRAWVMASRVRSALTLWNRSTSDVLPSDRQQLEGIARLLEYPPGSANVLEEDYLRVTRVARQVFERLFYGE